MAQAPRFNEDTCFQCGRTETKRVPASPLVGDGNAQECEDFVDCAVAQNTVTNYAPPSGACWRCLRDDTQRMGTRIQTREMAEPADAEECVDRMDCIRFRHEGTHRQLGEEFGGRRESA